jgi:hypothetical protein
MHAPFPRSSSLLLLLACACGGADDGDERSTLEEPATGSDGAPQPSSGDAGSGGSPSAPASAPPTLAEALDPEGVHTDVLRAKLVINEACGKLTGCSSAGASEAQCVDTTLSEWSLSALFFAEPCLDAQLDLYACYARANCDTALGCAEQQVLQQTLCSLEQ